MSSYDVYGLGNALVDMEYEVSESFLESFGVEKGLMTLVEEDMQNRMMEELKQPKMSCGGSAANTVIAVSQFGGSSFYSCKVANDTHGKFYAKDLEASGVSSNLGQLSIDGVTGKCLVLITSDAERTMNTYLGITAEFSKKEIIEAEIAKAKYLYIEGYLVASPTGLAAAIHARRVAKRYGVPTALTLSDPNMVKFFEQGFRDIIGDGDKVDLLFCNEIEAKMLARLDEKSGDLNLAVERLKEMADSFVITCGSEGALIFDGNNMIKIIPHKVQAKDSNGAGDMFAGAFLYGITQGHDFKVSGAFASLASSKIVCQFGPRLTRAEAQNMVKSFVWKS